MRRVLFMLVMVVFFIAFDAAAHCKKCVIEPGNCLACADTDYNGGVLCTIAANGSLCLLQGACEGPAGVECTRPPCPHNKWVSLHPAELKLKGEWQLASVRVFRVTPEVAPGKPRT